MPRIRVLHDFVRTQPGNRITRANAVYEGLNGNSAFSNLPVSLSDLRTEIDGYAAAVAESLDGSKRVFAETKARQEVLVHMLLLLARHVEIHCKGDMATFLKSGFLPRPTTRNQTPPLSEWIRKIVPGPNSGSVWLTLMGKDEAVYYEVQWGVTDADGLVTEWKNRIATQTRPAMLIKDLTPGATYAFQVRIVTKAGFTDWSDSVTCMCT